MTVKKVLNVRHYKAGYEIRKEVWETPGGDRVTMRSAYVPGTNYYIGDPKIARRLTHKYGIRPEVIDPSHHVCSIGFSERNQKWYGWSHRAIYGFGPGDTVTSEDHLCYPELPVGFTAMNMEDAKRMAIAFAKGVA